MCTKDLVSVIIPSFKRIETLPRAIDSVLKQTYRNLEIIVVNDNDPSTNHASQTHKIAENYRAKGAPILHISHPANLGGNAARNTGIRHSSGKWISFLDSDDEFEPCKLEKQLSILKNEKLNLSGICCATKRAVHGDIVEVRGQHVQVEDPLDVILYRVDLGGTSTFMTHRDLFEKIGLFDESLLRQQEIELLARCLAVGPILCIGEPLVIRHEDDRSNIPSTERYYKNKKKFLRLIEGFFHGDKKLEREVNRVHYLDVAKVAIRNKDWLFALKMIKAARPNGSHLLKFVSSGVRTLKRGT